MLSKPGERQPKMTKRFAIVLLHCLLLVSALPAALSQSDCDFSYSNYARAVQLHDMGDYARALRHYDCALAEDPDSQILPILIENLREDIASARTAWSVGGSSAPQPLCLFDVVHLMLGEAALKRGDHDQAQIHLGCAGLADPSNVAALNLSSKTSVYGGDAPSSQHSVALAEAAQAQEFQMPDWLMPYETMPDSRADKPTAALVIFWKNVYD